MKTIGHRIYVENLIQWRKLVWISVTFWLVESWFLVSPGEKLARSIGNRRYRIKTTVKETQGKRRNDRSFEKSRVYSSRNRDSIASRNCFEIKGKFWVHTYLQDLLDGYNYPYNETWTILRLNQELNALGIRDSTRVFKIRKWRKGKRASKQNYWFQAGDPASRW